MKLKELLNTIDRKEMIAVTEVRKTDIGANWTTLYVGFCNNFIYDDIKEYTVKTIYCGNRKIEIVIENMEEQA